MLVSEKTSELAAVVFLSRRIERRLTTLFFPVIAIEDHIETIGGVERDGELMHSVAAIR